MSHFRFPEIIEARWVVERRGLARFRTEQPPYSSFNRGIEREALPARQRYGMGVLVWRRFNQALQIGALLQQSEASASK